MSTSREDWHFGETYYVLTLASGPDSMDLELDEVGQRYASAGPLMIASCDDESQQMTLGVFTEETLPMDLVEKFIAKARETLPGRPPDLPT